MPATLENLPNEVFEAVVSVLALRDICALRLCNRTLAAKSTQEHFKSYFRLKHVDITGSSLQAFVKATQPDSLGCLIQHLVLVGVVNNTLACQAIISRERYSILEHSLVGESESESENEWEKEAKAKRDLEILKQRRTDYKELHESGTDVSLLSEALSNIATNSKTGELLELSLEVVVYRENAERRLHPIHGGGWKLIWKYATNTYHTAIRALAASQLPITKLSVFNDRRLQRCSLGCNELGSIDFEDRGLAVSLASLKSLSVSLSDKMIFRSIRDVERSYDPDEVRYWDRADRRRDRDEIQAEIDDEGNFIGFAKLLQLCSQLEELEIHYYRLYLLSRRTPDPRRERVLHCVAEAKTLPKLKRLELRGVHVTEEDLFRVIQRTGVRKLFMHEVTMDRGMFRSAFDYCTSNAAVMEELYFHNLLEGGWPLSFEGLGACHSQPPLIRADPDGRGNTLQREGDEIKERIIYGLERYDVNVVLIPWHLDKRVPDYREYGPPDRSHALAS